MTGNNCFINIAYIIYQVCNFLSILMRQAISGGIRNVNSCSAGFNNSFNYIGKVIIICSSCIFGIKFYIVSKISVPILHIELPVAKCLLCVELNLLLICKSEVPIPV